MISSRKLASKFTTRFSLARLALPRKRLCIMIKRNPDRKKFNAQFLQSLHDQARLLHLPAGLVAAVAWLGFALDTDHKLHPEFTELLYFRLALSGIALGLLFAVLLEKISGIRLRGKGLGWMSVLYGYVLLSCALFTGRIADDPNYVSGLQVVIMITVFIPFPLWLSYGLYTASMLLFAASIAWFGPNISTDAAQYSMQNVGIAYVLSFIMSVVLDHYRFHMFNNNRKIVEQGREVHERMEEVVKLKEKQDGDYFLTSLLIKPLIVNEASGHPVSVDFLLDQNKKFHFRRWDSEIGGDYLCAHLIELGSKQFTAVINGDAMGKSIQGAGGALVLGTVFQSVIQRTKQQQQLLSPEVWLKECFADLHNVFASFDGSMLASAVLGLVENDTGVLYYINAEHPRIVLYRQGRAAFLDDEHTLTKIGVMGISHGFRVQFFPLQPGDVLVLGSDGRDDLELKSLDGGGRVINEDESLFLRVVETAAADLPAIRQELVKIGQIVDDLSLLRIGYCEDESTARVEEKTRAIEAARANAEAINQKEDPAGAFDAYARRIDLDPADSEAVYTAAYLSKLAYRERKDRAILQFGVSLGERLRLRSPDHVRNLINLADLLRLTGNSERGRKILDEAAAQSPAHPSIAELRARLR